MTDPNDSPSLFPEEEASKKTTRRKVTPTRATKATKAAPIEEPVAKIKKATKATKAAPVIEAAPEKAPAKRTTTRKVAAPAAEVVPTPEPVAAPKTTRARVGKKGATEAETPVFVELVAPVKAPAKRLATRKSQEGPSVAAESAPAASAAPVIEEAKPAPKRAVAKRAVKSAAPVEETAVPVAPAPPASKGVKAAEEAAVNRSPRARSRAAATAKLASEKAASVMATAKVQGVGASEEWVPGRRSSSAAATPEEAAPAPEITPAAPAPREQREQRAERSTPRAERSEATGSSLERPARTERPERTERTERSYDRDRGDRPERNDRGERIERPADRPVRAGDRPADRNDRPEGNAPRDNRDNRDNRPQQQGGGGGNYRNRNDRGGYRRDGGRDYRNDRNHRNDRGDRNDRGAASTATSTSSSNRPEGDYRDRGGVDRGDRDQRIASARQEFASQTFEEDPNAPKAEPIFAEGIVEVSGKGFGFLRDAKRNFSQNPNDIFVTPEVCRRYNLRDGMWIKGEIRRGNRGSQLYKLTEIEGEDPEQYRTIPFFEELTTINPNRFIKMETTPERYTTRVIDMMAPIGRGQRGLIVAPPRTGKTTLLQHIAEAMLVNHPDMKLIVLLVDERPEEVTEIRRTVPGAEVMASSNDMDLKSHTRIVQLAVERAKRLVEMGKHVFILLDSITRVGRAFNNAQSGGGRTMSGGVDSRALEIPRKLFAAARNTEEAGSLTIIATALIETGSRMDDLIFQEFKGTGNMELVLDRKISDMRVYPAVDIFQSGTRREELLLPEAELYKINIIRRGLAGHKPAEAIERLLSFLRRFPTNAQMLREIPG